MPKDYTGIIFDYNIKNLSERENRRNGYEVFKKFIEEMRPDKLLAFHQPNENSDHVKCAAVYYEKTDNTLTLKTDEDKYVYVSYIKFSDVSLIYLGESVGEVTEKENLNDRLLKKKKSYTRKLPYNELSIDPYPPKKQDTFKPSIDLKRYKSFFDIPFEIIVTNMTLFPYIEYHYSHTKHDFDKTGEVHPFVFFKDDVYRIVRLNVFYCKKCNKYFDVKQSYLAQLRSVGIKPEEMIVAYRDENNKPINFANYKKLNEHSKLNLLGYKVGRGGLPPSKRHDILRFALKSGYMELFEIKEHIEFLIDYNGKKDNMDKAIDDWKSDLEFINKI